MRARCVVVLVACSGFALMGCGGNDKATTASTVPKGSTKVAETTETTVGSTLPQVTVVDDEFAKVIQSIDDQINAAGNDPCKVLAAFSGTVPTPANPDQTKQAIDVVARMFTRLADAAPPQAAAAAETVRATAAQLPEQAAAVGFDPTKVNQLPGLATQEFGSAIAQIQQTANCGVVAPPAG